MDADCGLRLMSNMQVLMFDAVRMGDARLEHMQVSHNWQEMKRVSKACELAHLHL